MTTTADATLTNLLAAICVNPRDDATRLIYADRCEEIGMEARAEFLRVQFEIANIEAELSKPYEDQDLCNSESGIAASWCPVCGDCCCHDRESSMNDQRCPLHSPRSRHCGDESLKKVLGELRQRETELLGVNWADWMPQVFAKTSNQNGFYYCENLYTAPPCPTPNITFRRGFVETVSCTCADWLAHGRQIVRQTPVMRVELTDKVPESAGNGCRWFFSQWSNESEVLPLALVAWFNRVQRWPGAFYHGVSSRFIVCEEANTALSQACINWARTTGTPPMPRLEDVK